MPEEATAGSAGDRAEASGPADILVKLYALPPLELASVEAAGVAIRRPIAPERHVVVGWVAREFEAGWASEVEVAFAKHPPSCFVAVDGQALLGFACFDATARGLFGPTGVAPAARGRGIGAALLMASLHAMREQGYAYAVIGAAGPIDFYRRLVGGLVVPDSWPGLYRGQLREPTGEPEGSPVDGGTTGL
jgi:GNAT superfamily N-acetyltransferase